METIKLQSLVFARCTFLLWKAISSLKGVKKYKNKGKNQIKRNELEEETERDENTFVGASERKRIGLNNNHKFLKQLSCLVILGFY